MAVASTAHSDSDDASTRANSRSTRANSRRGVGLSTSPPDISNTDGESNSCQGIADQKKVGFGTCGVFDVFYHTVPCPPFELPMERYLEEVLIGLLCATDGKTTGGPRALKRRVSTRIRERQERHEKTEGVTRWRLLKKVVDNDATRLACTMLFWISYGIVFDRVAESALQELRSRLASHWCLVVLHVREQVVGESDLVMRDWLLASLPVVMVQAVYRLFVDAFSEDRALFIKHTDLLLDKLTHIVNYEVSGFQLNKQTNRKARKLLFRKNVIDLPYMNLHESMKTQMRREMLENQNKELFPLAFGQQTGIPLEGTQLEHLMTGREEELQRSMSSKTPTADASLRPVKECLVPEDLSLERYDEVAKRGIDLLQRHLEVLLPMTAEDAAHEEETAVAATAAERNERQPSAASGRSTSCGRRAGTVASDDTDSASDGACLDLNQRCSTFKPGGKVRKVLEPDGKSLRERKEQEAADRRRREEQLKQRVVDEPLPVKFCERSLNTLWVSPIMDRLVPGERDRMGLRKRRAEAHQLKMGTPSIGLLPSIRKSQSMPTLGPGKAKAQAEEQPGPSKPAKELPKIAQQSVSAEGEGGLQLRREQVVNMDPPSSLESEVVMHRFEEQMQTFNQQSFGVYMKEYDIYTGSVKQRMDTTMLRNAEAGYVEQIQALVGGAGVMALKFPHAQKGVARRKNDSGVAGSLASGGATAGVGDGRRNWNSLTAVPKG